MKKNIKILLTFLLSLAIELIFFIILFVCITFSLEGVDEYSNRLFRMLLYVFISLFIGYIVFSNTFYRSLSSLLLGYKLSSTKLSNVKIIISNIFFYGLICIFTWYQIENNYNVIFQVLRILVLLELIPCFFPKVGTRLSLFLLRIDCDFKQKRKLENDGILL